MYPAEQLEKVNEDGLIGLSVIFEINNIQALEYEKQEQIKFEKNVQRIELQDLQNLQASYNAYFEQMKSVQEEQRRIETRQQEIHKESERELHDFNIHQCCRCVTTYISLSLLDGLRDSYAAKEKKIEEILLSDTYRSCKIQHMKRD